MKEAGRNSVETQSCLINTECVRDNYVCVTCITVLVATRKSSPPLRPHKYSNTRQCVFKKKKKGAPTSEKAGMSVSDEW